MGIADADLLARLIVQYTMLLFVPFGAIVCLITFVRRVIKL